MMKPSKQILLIATSAMALAFTVPAFAQETSEAAADEAPSTGDIIVTARRTEERLQDVPISITVFNQEQLSNRNVVNAQDLAAYTPSLSASTNFGADYTSYAIRGFVQDIGTSPSVGVYFAEVISPRAGINSGIQSGDGAGPGSFFDLQNVQVLKGPQGTLFGRNTTGGAILLVPQKPTTRLEGYVEGSIGNYDLRRIQGAINVPLADTFRIRLAVDHMDRKGFLRNDSGIGPGDFGDVHYTAVRASVVGDLTPNLENYTIASYLKSDNNSQIAKMIACDPTNQTFGALACGQLAGARARGADFYTVQNAVAQPFSKIEQWQVINTTTWRASDDLTVKNIASYAELRNRIQTPYGGTFWPVGLGSPLIFSVIMSPPGRDVSSQSTFTEELQFQGKAAGGRLDWQAGAYYEQSSPLGESGIASPILLSCPGGVSTGLQCTDPLGIAFTAAFGGRFPINVGSVGYSVGRTRFRNVGLYAQGTYDLTDQLSVTAGFRYTWDSQESTSTNISYLFPVLPPFTGGAIPVCGDVNLVAPNCTTSVSQRSSRPTWLISLEYKPTDDIMIYGKYARGYRAGGVFPNAPSTYRVYEPEKVDSFEAGLKWSFRGAVSGFFNLAAFYNDFSNQQLFVGFSPAPGRAARFTTGVVNAAGSRIYGLEVDASISPFEGFRIDGSYAYVNARVSEVQTLVSTDPNFVVTAPVLPGDPILLTPEHKLSVTGSYTLPLDESIGEITLGVTYSYTSEQLSSYDFNNPRILAAYGRNLAILEPRNLVNLNLNWKSIGGSPVDLALFATNVTEEKYYTYVPALGGSGFVSATVGEPRMYGLRLRYNFGR